MKSTPAPTPLPEYGSPISLALAKQVMAAAETEALTQKWPLAICVVDTGGHVVLQQRMDQVQWGSIEVAQKKAITAVSFRRSTKVFEDAVAGGGIGTRILSMSNVLAVEGGLPLFVDGKIVGAIGVSGMQASQDAQVALAGAKVLD